MNALVAPSPGSFRLNYELCVCLPLLGFALLCRPLYKQPAGVLLYRLVRRRIRLRAARFHHPTDRLHWLLNCLSCLEAFQTSDDARSLNGMIDALVVFVERELDRQDDLRAKNRALVDRFDWLVERRAERRDCRS